MADENKLDAVYNVTVRFLAERRRRRRIRVFATIFPLLMMGAMANDLVSHRGNMIVNGVVVAIAFITIVAVNAWESKAP